MVHVILVIIYFYLYIFVFIIFISSSIFFMVYILFLILTFFSPEGSSTSVGRSGNCQSPVLAVENVDVRQSILLDISLDGIHVSQFRSSSRSHTFYLHVQHCSGYMAFISTSDMSIPA